MKHKSNILVSVIKHFVLICIAAIMVFPFVWMVSTSLKDTYAVYSYPPKFFSWPLEFANYQSVWTSLPFGAAFLNSLTITVLIVFFSCLLHLWQHFLLQN